MYKIYFFRDDRGRQPELEYIEKIRNQNSKDSRIKSNKIRDYLKILQLKGLQAGEPFIKHIEGEIWELRPLRDRFFFVAWLNESFVLIHHFMKSTQKTPKKEIDQAKRNLKKLKMELIENE